MSHTVVTLICNPNAPALTDDIVSKASFHATGAGLGGAWQRWLHRGVAYEYFFDRDGVPSAALANVFRAAMVRLPVDVVVQPAENREKRLLVADMDSTIIGQECIDELAEFVGKRAEISAITERAMRGELDFEAALMARLAMLKGLPERVLEETFARRITLNPGAKTLVATMKARGAVTALVSGGFTFFTTRVAASAGFDLHDANTLIVESGAITGEVARPIKGRGAKEAALLRIAAERAIPVEQTMAVGDGANDLGMIARAGLGVAFHAKPAVAAAAGARIDHGDLTALLYLQGIPQAEFKGREEGKGKRDK